MVKYAEIHALLLPLLKSIYTYFIVNYTNTNLHLTENTYIHKKNNRQSANNRLAC